MNDNRILVTGGAGFIGSNLANELAASNEVIAIDDGYLGIRENLVDDVTFHAQSVLDDDLPTEVDVVFHLAGLSPYAVHEDDPCRGARVNVEGFVNTVDQARRDGCSTVVYASRSSLYESQAAPTSEDETVRAATAYQASKLAREQYGEYFVNHYDLNAAGMRIFSAYQGYAESADHEEEYANVVGQFADDLAHGRSPAVYGEGTQTRDFIHVEDIVRGLIAAADHRLDGLYNLGTGRSVSFEELIEMLADELGTDADPEYIESPIPKAACVDDARADISKIRSETEWTPEVSLEEGLARVCSQYGAPKP